LLCVVQAAIDARQLFVGRLVGHILKRCIDVERNVGELVLRVGRLVLDLLKRLVKQFGFHGGSLA
jgi:hypothetical protein